MRLLLATLAATASAQNAKLVVVAQFRLTLKMRANYALALYKDDGATLDDLREAVTTFEDAGRIARRVFGGAHPLTVGIEYHLRNTRALESGNVSALREAVDAMNATSN